MNIRISNSNETLLYAKDELEKYLLMMDPALSDEVDISFAVKEYDGIDPMLDDIIEVDVEKMNGTIAGSNDRSVLMGVYTLLKSAGCMWVRPGKLGEYIPQKPMADHSCHYYRKADQPFRGECIEGGVSLENVIDTVEWLPKVNANLFMIQHVVPYVLFTRWYEHEDNPYKEKEDFPYELGLECVTRIEKEVKKRGLQLHTIGHGYIYEKYGLPYRKRSDTYYPSAEAVSAMAMINGKRGFFKLVPNHTQPCLSQSSVRKNMADWLVEYLQRKPYVDFLHVWLSDSRNNHCECEECVKMLPSDFYVLFLNELDAALAAAGIDTKVVFILYTDTYWAPLKMKLKNPDRFIMTVASSGRSYDSTYLPERYKEELPAFHRNNNTFNVVLPMTLSFVDKWESQYSGKRFMFDYHFYQAHYADPSYMQMARRMHEDARCIGDIGFDGVMDCKTQRSYFPTGLPMAIYGETLFDQKLDFESYTKSYFEKAFGHDAEEARTYLERVCAIFDPEKLLVADDIVVIDTGTGGKLFRQGFVGNEETVTRISDIYSCLDDFKTTIEKDRSNDPPCVQESWRILALHQDYCRLLANIYVALGKGDKELAQKETDLMKEWLGKNEDEFQPYLDLVLCVQKLDRLMK